MPPGFSKKASTGSRSRQIGSSDGCGSFLCRRPVSTSDGQRARRGGSGLRRAVTRRGCHLHEPSALDLGGLSPRVRPGRGGPNREQLTGRATSRGRRQGSQPSPDRRRKRKQFAGEGTGRWDHMIPSRAAAVLSSTPSAVRDSPRASRADGSAARAATGCLAVDPGCARRRGRRYFGVLKSTCASICQPLRVFANTDSRGE